MAVIIAEEPSCTFLRAYEAICFEFWEVDVSPGENTSCAIEVRIFIDGALQTFGDGIDSISYTPTRISGPVNIFRVNVSGILQKCFDNDAAMPNISDSYNALASDCIKEFYLEVTAWCPNENCIKVKDPDGTATTQTFRFINAKKEACKDRCLDELFTDGTLEFLTNRPRKRIVCRDEQEFLSVWNPNSNLVYIVRQYDASGAPLQSGILLAVDSNGGNGIQVDNLHCIGVSPSQLEAAPQWLTLPAMTFGDNVAYYEITIGTFPFFEVGETIRYYIDKACCTAYRIHFLNCFGKFDSFSVNKNVFEEYATTSSSFRKGVAKITDVTNNKRTRYRNKLYSRKARSFTAHIQNLCEEDAIWLEELSNSPNVFLQKDNDLISVEVQDVQGVTKNTYARDTELILRFIYSEDEVSQRN